jgi:membrane protein
MTAKAIGNVLKETAQRWWRDEIPRMGAALSFYTMLSLAPLLVVVTAVAGLVFDREAVQGGLVEQIRALAGRQAAEVIRTLMANASENARTGVFATAVGVVLLLVGATGVFAELQDVLNTIWGAKQRSSAGLWGVIRDRFLSFLMVLGVGFLLVVSLVVSTALAALGKFGSGLGPVLTPLLHVLHLLVSIGLISLLFALMFRFLPDVEIAWGDVWVGAVVTAVLFSVGRFLIGLYLGSSSMGSAYGAAGSFAVFFVWVYYSAQIFYFGAEFTQVYTNRLGSHVRLPGTTPGEPAEAHQLTV